MDNSKIKAYFRENMKLTKNNTNKFVAVFIDGDWLYAATKRINKRVDYAKFIRILMDKFGHDVKVYFFGAINSADKRQTIFYKGLRKNGYILHLTELTKTEVGFVSKGTEIALAINAIQLLPLFKKFVLVSSDGDFVPLLKKVRNAGVEISVVALPFTSGYFMRKAVGGNFLNLEEFVEKYKEKSILVTSKINKDRNKIFPENIYIEKGEQIASYVFIKNLACSAKKTITIVDQYLDEQIIMLIDLLEIVIDVKIFTHKKISPEVKLQIIKLREKGRSVTVYGTKIFHDRFMGIDNNWWHSGHSFKDLGEKNSFLSKIATKKEQEKLKRSIKKEIELANVICE